jgi:glutathione reductase (NADPH)
MRQFDLIVIGGGSGGVRAARIAAGYGARVALIEEHRLGGTCVIRGCVPKKLMVYAARFAQEFEEAAGFGWNLDKPALDWARLKARRDTEVARLEAIYRQNLVKAGVEILAGHARFANANTVVLDGGEELMAPHILIATGAVPAGGPQIAGQGLAMDSNGFFDLDALPATAVVQGAGYIALELACVLQLLGTRVHLVVRGTRVLRGFDDELATHLAHCLAEQGMTLHATSRISNPAPAGCRCSSTTAMHCRQTAYCGPWGGNPTRTICPWTVPALPWTRMARFR